MPEQFMITVIIPVFNAEKYLPQALDSVLNQTEPPQEVIVVDDGSTDHSAEVIQAYSDRVQYLYQGNAGASAARNLGVQAAHGNYIAFLDADDYWSLNKLEMQRKAMQEDPSLDMVFAWIEQFYSPETDDCFRKAYHCPEEPSRGAHPGTMLIKTTSFFEVGLFSTRYETGEIIEWYGRVIDRHMKSATLPEVLMYRRIHPDNHGIVHKNDAQDYARVVRDMLMRRKAEQNKHDRA